MKSREMSAKEVKSGVMCVNRAFPAETINFELKSTVRSKIVEKKEKMISVREYCAKTGMNAYYVRKLCRTKQLQGVIRTEFGYRIPISQIRAKKTPTRKYYKIRVETVRKLMQTSDINAFLTEIDAI